MLPDSNDRSSPPSPADTSNAAQTRRATWRRRRVLGLAAAGSVAAIAIAAIAFIALHHPRVAPVLALDAVVDDSMNRHYGAYSQARQGWVYVDPQDHRSYLMRVIQRAKVAEASAEMSGYTAVYFLASGAPLDDSPDHDGQAQHSLVGLFVIEPDTHARDGALVETAQPHYDVYGAPPLRAQDVHFEALSTDTYGWVFKIVQPVDDAPAARFVDNVLLAPHAGAIVEMATFPAQASYRPAGGCGPADAGQAAPAMPGKPGSIASGAAGTAAAIPASASAADEPPADEADAPDPTDGCSEAAWSYKTGPLPGDGFVEISVTGGGLFDGVQRPVKTWQLVFDPKSFSYVVPEDLQLL